MSSKSPMVLIVLTLAAWQWPTTTAAQQDSTKLLAPTYPGAILVPYQNDDDAREIMVDKFGVGTPAFTDETRTFLAKDPIDVVRAFYDDAIGPHDACADRDAAIDSLPVGGVNQNHRRVAVRWLRGRRGHARERDQCGAQQQGEPRLRAGDSRM